MARIKLHSETVGLGHERLRARVAELQAKYPGAEIKTRRLPRYGNGYTISVHGEGAATRVQTRGHCQFCGNHQVIKDGALVKHGYKRPGTGYEVGRCPGAGRKPLQVEDTDTRRYLADERVTLAKLVATAPELERLEREAGDALSASGESIYRANNERPYLRSSSAWNPPTPEQKAQHELAVKAWEAKYPHFVAHREAMQAVTINRAAIGQAEAFIAHFERLIAANLVGSPYVEVEK